MIYGKEKSFQMSKSILPSRKRKTARIEKARVHRETRRSNKQILGFIVKDLNYDEDGKYDFEHCENRINEVKYNRQEADKVQPFIHWAKEATKDLPRDSRLSYLKSVLPKNTIGRHAVSHLKFMDEFMSERELQHYLARPYYNPPPSYNLKDFLYELLSKGFHREFNSYLRSHHHLVYDYDYIKVWTKNPYNGKDIFKYVAKRRETPQEECRILYGFHDIEKFLKDIKSNSRHPEWAKSVKYLAQEYQNCYKDWDKVITKLKLKAVSII